MMVAERGLGFVSCVGLGIAVRGQSVDAVRRLCKGCGVVEGFLLALGGVVRF